MSSETAVGVTDLIDADGAHPLPVYLTGTELNKAKRIVLVFTDVFGIDTGNHKVVADRLGRNLANTAVVIPDLFRGEPILTEGPEWIPKAILRNGVYLAQIVYQCKFRITKDALDRDLVDILLPWIRQRNTVAQVSCVGFCFGGWLTAHILALSNNRDLPFVCGVGIHPSFKIETIHGRTEAYLAERVGTKPLLLLSAQNDNLHPGNESVEILAKNRGVESSSVAVSFDSMIHGWVTRGDSSDPSVKEEQDRATQLTISFIEEQHKTE